MTKETQWIWGRDGTGKIIVKAYLLIQGCLKLPTIYNQGDSAVANQPQNYDKMWQMVNFKILFFYGERCSQLNSVVDSISLLSLDHWGPVTAWKNTIRVFFAVDPLLLRGYWILDIVPNITSDSLSVLTWQSSLQGHNHTGYIIFHSFFMVLYKWK